MSADVFVMVLGAALVHATWNALIKIDGDRLIIESAPAASILFPGKVDFRKIVWERER